MSMQDTIPHGFNLRHTLRGHEKVLSHICWSPDGKMLASGSSDGICLWDTQTGQPVRTIEGLVGYVHTMAWSPDGTLLAVGGQMHVDVKPFTNTCSLGHINPPGETFCDECGEPLPSNISQPIQPIASNLFIISTETGKGLQTINISYPGDAYIYGLEWSPDGTVLAANDGLRVYLWLVQKDQLLRVQTTGRLYMVEWFLNGTVRTKGFAPTVPCPVCDNPNSIEESFCSNCGATLVKPEQKPEQLRILQVKPSYAMAKSPDGTMLALGGCSTVICPWCSCQNPVGEDWCSNCGGSLSQLSRNNLLLLDTATWQVKNEFTGHTGRINAIVWALDQGFLVSGSGDGTIRIWKPGGQKQILEGYISNVTSLSLSHEGSLLASRSTDGSVCIWDTQNWEMRAILDEPHSDDFVSVAFHPQAPILATLCEGNTAINIWHVDIAELVATPPLVASSHYMNAKIVLVGDSGVGKSGLSLGLTGQLFKPTDSTHGRKVLTFEQQNLKQGTGQKEQRELLLWDLAGQPGYRLIHQLYLAEVSVALVVFDARSETDPLGGVDHWVRALRVVRRAQEREPEIQPMKMFLVAARIDRGGRNVSAKRIEKILKEEGFDGYFETSAKDGTGITELSEAIKHAIDWKKLTRVTSSLLFQRIKEFLVFEKETERLLATYDDLYREFLIKNDISSRIKDIATQFELCVKQVEQKGLIRRLSFGKYILLQPELLDSYATSLVNAVKAEPDELGTITEERVLMGDFSIPQDERIKNRAQEKLLLIAMVEDLLNYEIALREDGKYLVFPSQSMRENPDLPDPEGKAVIFRFEGPVINIYTTLVVRLSHSGLFIKDELWRNAVTFTTKIGGIYGLCLRTIAEGRGELVLFFDKTAGEETRSHFEEYVNAHLQRWAIPETVQRKRIIVCPNPECGMPLDELHVAKRLQLGHNSMICGVCETRFYFHKERPKESSNVLISAMDSMADLERERSKAVSSLQGKQATDDFDVFLCYNEKDRPAVKKIGEKLKEAGILPWLDEWEQRPGLPWQRLLQEQIGQIKSAAVFVGKEGLGPWQHQQLDAFLQEFVRRGCPVIPVILSDAPQEPELPIFLRSIRWVDFRQQASAQDLDPMDQLIWGITGKRRRP